MYGVHSAKRLRQEAARVLGASRFQVFVKVILPDALGTGREIGIAIRSGA